MMITRYYWILLVSLLLMFGYIPESHELVIKSINIPSIVKVDSVDHVILDCDYALENTSSEGLVVQWFFNDNRVIYQWIYGKKPSFDELVAKYIDLTYKASLDPFTEYRAIKLDKPGIDLTGDYTCVISTFEDEQMANATMTIYSTEKDFNFVYRRKNIDNKDGLEATCNAEGIYPQPTLEIIIKGVPERKTSKSTVTFQNGLYNILSRVNFLDEELPEVAELKCILSIPRTNYNKTQTTIYYSGTATTISPFTTISQRKMDIQDLDNSNLGTNSGNFVNCASINLVLLPILPIIFHFVLLMI